MAEEKKNERIPLPEAFCRRMKELLGEEYDAFVESYEKDRCQGLRFDPGKEISEEAFRDMTERFGLRRIPWAPYGYYYDGESRPGRHPYHEAGVYYIQEPSAMAVAELLSAEPGQRILDLCAAPGGKTTQAAGALRGAGLLVSNEIHPARARILAQNVERMGIGNCLVTNEEPARLAEYFPEFFDGILVDAPCSGEGMFRKDEEARNQWSPDHVKLCARRQGEILSEAAKMLRPGGRLVYSTCTFAPEENEGAVGAFLLSHPEFSVEPAEAYKGFSSGRPEWALEIQKELSDLGRGGELDHTFRLWPHKIEGEGHFAAVLRKREDPAAGKEGASWEDTEKKRGKEKGGKKKNGKGPGTGERKMAWELWQEFWKQTAKEDTEESFLGEQAEERLFLMGDQLYLLPEGMREPAGLRVLRPGLHLGTLKKGRFEPSHALALRLRPGQVKRSYVMPREGEETAAYLRGETLRTEEPEGGFKGKDGWTLMVCGEFSIGWAKRSGEVLKNHYPKGLRKI